MAQAYLPIELQQSYLNYLSYPRNLVPDGANIHSWTLNAYKTRFDTSEESLCLENEIDVNLPIRDLDRNSQMENELRKRNIHTADELDQWLGAKINTDRANSNIRTVTYTAKDPTCRFIYLYADHSRDHLRITRNMLAQILTYHQVMPEYLDFIFVFGTQSDARDLRFSGFYEQTEIKESTRSLEIPGRSGRRYQLCYNLKGVTLKDNVKEWSIRQAVIYHQFDVVHGTTLWIVAKGRLDIQQRFKELTGPNGRLEDKSFGNVYECFQSSLAAHLLYCHWSMEDWRWYIRWLEELVDTESSMAMYERQGPGHAQKQYMPHNIQDLHRWKDDANEAAMMLESNVDVLTALQEYYVGLKANNDFSLAAKCQESIENFAASVGKSIDGLRMQMSRAKWLAGTISDRKELVIQHLQIQATERTERLNLNLEKEAVVMRIITIVTLIYLPATFVSTFFSTDVVKYQGQNGGKTGLGTFSSIAMIRWLQVTVPLTVVTLSTAWLTYRSADNVRQGKDRKRRQIYSCSPKSAEETAWFNFRIPWRKESDETLPLHNAPKEIL